MFQHLDPYAGDPILSLNEAYGVLKDHALRKDYDRGRRYNIPVRESFVPRTTPPAQNVGVFGHVLSSLLCLIAGFFLLVLVRFQWIWFCGHWQYWLFLFLGSES
jgi:hypothetical protein